MKAYKFKNNKQSDFLADISSEDKIGRETMKSKSKLIISLLIVALAYGVYYFLSADNTSQKALTDGDDGVKVVSLDLPKKKV